MIIIIKVKSVYEDRRIRVSSSLKIKAYATVERYRQLVDKYNYTKCGTPMTRAVRDVEWQKKWK